LRKTCGIKTVIKNTNHFLCLEEVIIIKTELRAEVPVIKAVRVLPKRAIIAKPIMVNRPVEKLPNPRKEQVTRIPTGIPVRKKTEKKDKISNH
jgi:hypothetical protein